MGEKPSPSGEDFSSTTVLSIGTEAEGRRHIV